MHWRPSGSVVSIASSSANSFTVFFHNLARYSQTGSQSLLHQRTVSRVRRLSTASLSTLQRLNRFFISEQFHSWSRSTGSASPAPSQSLLISEQFHSASTHLCLGALQEVSIASSSANSFTVY